MSDTMWKDAFSYYSRRNEVSNFYSNYEDMLRVTRGYPNVHFRYTVAPTQEVPSSGLVPISASNEDIRKEIDIGYQDGLRAIRDSLDDGSNLDNLLAHLKN